MSEESLGMYQAMNLRFIQALNSLEVLSEVLERKGIITRDEFVQVYEEVVINPEKDRQSRIMEGQKQCPNRCPVKQPLMVGGDFEHALCNSVYANCPRGFNPNAIPKCNSNCTFTPETPIKDDPTLNRNDV
jgi:hypothetical protein